MVLIPAGEFTMGDNTRYNWTFLLAYNIYDGPEHVVYLDTYYIDKYEVTNEQYRTFVEETGYHTPRCWNDARFNRPNQPVVGVTWDDAVAYTTWAGRRLPTEAEWEKAARGTDKRLWPWGNKFDKEKCNVWESLIKETKHIGSYENNKSPYGCYDMAGNVWEWCADYYDQNYYHVSPSENPQGPETGQQRIIRGVVFFTLDIMGGVLRGIGFRHMHRVRKSDFAVQRHLKNNLLLREFSQNVPLTGRLLLLKILRTTLLQVSGIFR